MDLRKKLDALDDEANWGTCDNWIKQTYGTELSQKTYENYALEWWKGKAWEARKLKANCLTIPFSKEVIRLYSFAEDIERWCDNVVIRW